MAVNRGIFTFGTGCRLSSVNAHAKAIKANHNRARDIAVFPWEKKKKNNLPKDKISEEEMMKRYRAVMKRRRLR